MTGSRASWIHLAGLTFIVAVFLILHRAAVATPVDPGFLARLSVGLKLLPSSIYPILPVLVGLSVGMPRARGGLTRHAAVMALLVTVLMLVIDLTALPVSEISLSRTVVQGDSVRASRVVHLGPVNAIPALISTIREGGTGMDEVLSEYSAAHPRVTVALSVNRLMLMTLPMVLAGMVLGMGAWMSGRVSFREERDGRIARLVLVWLVIPWAYYLVQVFVDDALASVLGAGDSFFVLIIPYLPVFGLCALGWRSSYKEESAVAPSSSPDPLDAD